MKIFHVTRDLPVDYDEASDMVVIAASDADARRVAALAASTEGAQAWNEAHVRLLGVASADERAERLVIVDGHWTG